MSRSAFQPFFQIGRRTGSARRSKATETPGASESETGEFIVSVLSCRYIHAGARDISHIVTPIFGDNCSIQKGPPVSPGFCSSAAKRLIKAVIVLRGVRK
jgi:hypothetical protein